MLYIKVSCGRRMKKEFLVNISILLVANLLIKVYYLLGIDRNIQLAVGVNEYGLYYSLFTFTLVFQFINDFGLQIYTNRFLSQNEEEITGRFKDLIGFKIALSIAYGIAIVLFYWLWEDGKDHFGLVMLMAFNQIVVSGIYFIRSSLAGLAHYRIDSFISILDRLLLVLFGSFLLWVPVLRQHLSIYSFVWIQTLSLVITFLISFRFLVKKQRGIRLSKFNLAVFKSIFMVCFPFALIYLFTSLYSRIDVLLLHGLLEEGEAAVGIYAASMRLFEATTMISLAFAGLLLAMFSRLHLNLEKLSGLFQLSIKWLLVLTLMVSVVSYYYASDLIRMLYHTDNEIWIRTLRYIMIAFIPASLNFIMGVLLQAIHQEKKLIGFYLSAALLSVCFNYFLIPVYGVIGAAIAAIIVYNVLFFSQLVYVWMKSYVIFTKDFILFSIIFSVCCWLGAYLVSLMDLGFVVKLFMTLILIALLALAFRMISLVEMADQPLINSKHSDGTSTSP